MASSIHLLLLLLLMASSEAQSHKHVASSLAFRPKGKSPDGKYQVELRYRPTGVDNHENSFACLWTDCGSNVVKYRRTVAHDSYNLTWHSFEVLAVLQLSSDFLFEMKFPDYYNHYYSMGYWVPTAKGTLRWQTRTSLDLGTRSDTGESNRPPITSTVPIIRVTRNCPRTFRIPTFDPDGDRVMCSVETYPYTRYRSCSLCGLDPAFTLNGTSCTLTYRESSIPGNHPVEILMEDYPRQEIHLTYSDGSYTTKRPLRGNRHKRAAYPTTTATPTTTAYPTTTPVAPTTTTAAPTTTTAAPTTTTAAPTTTTAYPTTTTYPTTTAYPTTTTAYPTTTTTAPTTTTAAPTTSTAAPTTTTVAPTTTTAAPTTTTVAPTTTTAAPTTTTAYRTTTTAAPTTTSAAPTTTTIPPPTTPPYRTTIDPLSVIPLDFTVFVDSYEAPSCVDGDYFPLFVSPTPQYGFEFTAFVNQTLEIKVRSVAQYAKINDLILTGPSGISKERVSTDTFTIKWTPTELDKYGYYPICFVSEALNNYQAFHSEMRCVTVYVARHEATVTCNETTMTIEMEKTSVIRSHEGSLRLNSFTDSSCNLTKNSNSTHLVGVMPLSSCGTLIEEDNDDIIFSNVITSADVGQTISRGQHVDVAFSCAYPKRANLSLGFSHKNPYAFSERGFGSFSFQFEFFETERFARRVEAGSYPVRVYLRQMLYMQIDSSSSIPDTQLFVESCRATPYDNPNARLSYSIIEDGCVRDQTVQIYNSSKGQFRFGMEAFEFIGTHDEVYISCSVILCESGVPGTRCSQGCLGSPPHRRRREAAAQTGRHSISQGPLHLAAEAPGSRSSGPGWNLGLNLVFIVGCLLVCGVVVYRSRGTNVKYQPLPTSDH